MPFVYESSQQGPLELDVVHDPDSSIYYSLRYRPEVWETGVVKNQVGPNEVSGDVVLPTTEMGYYAECISSGITGNEEPDWPTKAGRKITDGTTRWQVLPDIFALRSGDAIIASSWTGDTGVILDNDGLDVFEAVVRVTAVPVGATSFTITNEVTVLRENGNTEILNRSLLIPILEM